MRTRAIRGASRPSRRAVLAGLTGAAVLTAGTAEAAGASTAEPGSASTTGSTAEATTEALPLAVELLEITPTAYAADDPDRATITVRARVRNTSADAVPALRARLVAQRSAAVGRQALGRWAQASPTASTTRATAVSDDVVVGGGGLAAGAAAEVVLVLPAADLGTGTGAHPAAVEVVSGDDEDAERVGIVRTFLISAPPPSATTRLTLLLPVVTGRDASALAVVEAVEGRLGHLLAASADPRTAWALDPGVLAAAQDVQPPAPAPEADGPAPPAAQPPAGDPAAPTDEQRRAVATWLSDLRAAAAGRAVVVLPHGDPDLASLTGTSAGPGLLTRATTAAADTLGTLGLPDAVVLDDVAWPADQAADDRVLALAAAAGSTTVVVDDASLVPDADLPYTPTGRADLGAGLSGLVADRVLSALLGDLGTGTGGGGAVGVRQRVLAEIATTTLQRPNDARSLLLVAPRSFDPDPVAVSGLLSDVEVSGWGRWQGLPDLLAAPAPAVERSGPAIPTATRRAQLPAAGAGQVAAALAQVDDFATALQGTETSLQAQRLAALLLLGVSWRGHADGLPAARQALAVGTAALAAGIRIVGGSVRNLAAERSELPITLVNELDVPVQVDLVLRPRTPRVQLDAVPRQVVAARSQQRVAVPVRALANGSVVVEAELRTPAGSRIGDPVDVDLNVRADVENWITGVVGGGAVVVFALGVVRAVRKGRRRVDEAEHASLGQDADEDRTSAPTGQG